MTRSGANIIRWTWRSPAKINLHLAVAPPGGDGFHPLRSWFVTIGLVDVLRFELLFGNLSERFDATNADATNANSGAQIGRVSRLGSSFTVCLDSDDPRVPMGRSNLIVRAIDAMTGSTFERLSGERLSGSLRVMLEKRIPMGGGLGGGSGNAATTMLAMRRMMEDLGIEGEGSSSGGDESASGSLPDGDVATAAGLGSDVPFFLSAPSAEVWGRGEFLRTAPAPRCGGVLLILPPFGVSTPAAFRRLDELRPTAPGDVVDPLPIDDWSKLDAESLGRVLRNDLELAAFDLVPELGRLRDRVESALGRSVRMSGSGSSLFAIFDDEEEAESAANQMERRMPLMEDGRSVSYLGLPLARDVPSCVGVEAMDE